MYRLLKPLPYQWSMVRENTVINPYFSLDLNHKIIVRFLELLDTAGKSYGIWTRENIDTELLSHICRAIQASERDWEFMEDEQTWCMHFD